MKNTLLMKIEATFSLNFLVYLQNIYLNQNLKKDHLKFPYTSSNYEFPNDFEKRYEGLWIEMSTRIYKLPVNDLLKKDKNLFYKSLFNEDDVTIEEFKNVFILPSVVEQLSWQLFN